MEEIPDDTFSGSGYSESGLRGRVMGVGAVMGPRQSQNPWVKFVVLAAPGIRGQRSSCSHITAALDSCYVSLLLCAILDSFNSGPDALQICNITHRITLYC